MRSQQRLRKDRQRRMALDQFLDPRTKAARVRSSNFQAETTQYAAQAISMSNSFD